MDQPTAEEALARLEVLVGEWAQEATPPGGEPWPGENGVCVIGCDAASGRYYQLYTDDRNVCRVYEMSLEGREWKLWRDGEPFSQRFTATISEDGNTIEGRWEAAKDGTNWETDFDLIFHRVR
jgi:hypothetical protein